VSNGVVALEDPVYGKRWKPISRRAAVPENETNTIRLCGIALGFSNGINDAVVNGRAEAVNPAHGGRKPRRTTG
jgi:hypothetical protein